MSDASLIKLFTNKEIHSKFKKYVKTKLLGDIHREFLNSFGDYFAKFDHENIETDNFLTWFVQNYKSECDDTVIALYATAWENVINADITVMEDVLIKYHEEALKEHLQTHIELEKFDINTVVDLCKKHEELKDKVLGIEDKVVTNDITRICESVDRSNGLRWRLECLNKSIGPLILGDLIVVFAFVDTGKTRFIASEITNMASQIEDGNVLYFNNEEPCDRVFKYLYCATLKRTFEVVAQNRDVAATHYERIMHGDKERIVLVDADEYNISDIEEKIKKYKPKLVVVDLVNNLASSGGDRHDLAITSVAWKLRKIAKTYCPVIAVLQSDQSATWYDKETGDRTPKRYISMSQLADSKVGLPGKADAIIGIGRDDAYPNSRYIHVSKNKLNVTGNSVDIRLQKDVYFDGARCLYLDAKD